MSVTIRRSSTKRGSGVISAITIARTASGTAISLSTPSGSACTHRGSPDGAGIALAGVILSRQPPVHEFEDVGQDLRHRPVQMRRNLLPHLHRFVERLRQR